MITILSFIFVLSILVFFHELGHFLAARICGVGVEIFSLGFGPRLTGKTAGRTDYRISAIPLGGFVKMVGEDPEAEVDPEDLEVSFTHKSLPRRFIIVAAGPLFNFLLTIILFFGLFWAMGISEPKTLAPLVGKVNEDSPALSAGIQEGDRIISIDGAAVDTWEQMAEIISSSGGKALSMVIRRNDADLKISITPKLISSKNIMGNDMDRYVIGITSRMEFEHRELNMVQAFRESIRETYDITALTITSIGQMIGGSIPLKENLGGPIVIAQMSGEMAQRGLPVLINWIALLSVSLGILNLLPIPVLDGGHLLFFTIEAVIRKPLNTRAREIAQQAGIFVLLLLMIFVFYNDISRIFFS